jgi:methionine synthase II (cobalamin-independent)
MKIYFDLELIYEINDFDIKVLKNNFFQEDLEKIIKERLRWDIQSFCEQAYNDLKNKWIPILFVRLKSIPTDKEELLKVIMSQPDYRDKASQEIDNKANKELSFKVD